MFMSTANSESSISIGPILFNKTSKKDPPPGSIEVFQQTQPGNCVLKERESLRNALNRLLEENYQLRFDIKLLKKGQEHPSESSAKNEDPQNLISLSAQNSKISSKETDSKILNSAIPISLIHYDVTTYSPMTLLERLVNHLESVTDPENEKTKFTSKKIKLERSSTTFNVDEFFNVFFKKPENENSEQINEAKKPEKSSSDTSHISQQLETEEPISEDESSTTPIAGDVTSVTDYVTTSQHEESEQDRQNTDQEIVQLHEPSDATTLNSQIMQPDKGQYDMTEVDKALSDLVASLANDLLKDDPDDIPDDIPDDQLEKNIRPSKNASSHHSWQSDDNLWSFEVDECDALNVTGKDANMTQNVTFSFEDVRYVIDVIKAMLQRHKKQMEIRDLAAASDSQHIMELEKEKIRIVELKEQNWAIFDLLRQAEHRENSLIYRNQDLKNQLSETEAAEYYAKSCMTSLKKQNWAIYEMMRRCANIETSLRMQAADNELKLNHAVEVNNKLRELLRNAIYDSTSEEDSSSDDMSEYTPMSTSDDDDDVDDDNDNDEIDLDVNELVPGLEHGMVRVQLDFRFSLILRFLNISTKVFQTIGQGIGTIPSPVLEPNWDEKVKFGQAALAGSVLLADSLSFYLGVMWQKIMSRYNL